jgi:hypothetical protein
MRIHQSEPMSNDRRDVFGSDCPTEDSIRRSIEACRAERIRNGLDPDTGAFPETADDILARTLEHLNIPDAVIERIPRATEWELRLRIRRLETEAEGLKCDPKASPAVLIQLHHDIDACYAQLKGML